MTTNTKERFIEINNSLSLWQNDINDIFGEPFFKHFKKSYLEHLKWKVLVKNFKLRRYIRFSLSLIEISNLKKLYVELFMVNLKDVIHFQDIIKNNGNL